MTEVVAALLRPPAPLQEVAASWAARLQLPLVDADAAAPYDLLMTVSPDPQPPGYRLALQLNVPRPPGPVSVDFVGGALGHRRRFGGGRGQPLARAVGLKQGATPRVADVTAGLGRDGFVLAHLGCTVTLVERLPLVAALLENGLQRAAGEAELRPVIERMHLVAAEGREWLRTLPPEQAPDVIYLDPMYPARSKQALVKKEMQLFHRLVGDDADAPALLAEALGRARKRVVVKRPRQAEPLAGPSPQFAIQSPNTRYDVYPTG